MPKVLVSDPIAPEGIEILKRVADVDVKTALATMMPSRSALKPK